jgi:hypothetical protein
LDQHRQHYRFRFEPIRLADELTPPLALARAGGPAQSDTSIENPGKMGIASSIAAASRENS